ncbi:flp-26 [Pristionchus pacificus]|uniref:Uncharacterized protein n=1 Tax=Pristionchus pacificus TaxID=54126 RepID=A0A454XYS6_PRIPA|nr:flp-26 [Pristionchus pacificus]|eukprot:PDM77011.1 hypothetical protein PRIPAC_42406 [Pristionchus pacificus]
MTRTGLLTIILLSLLALLSRAYILPYEAYAEDGYYYFPSVAKRSASDHLRHASKREFNVDDLTLRFGKRSGGLSSFGADDLALRFGRRR